MTNLYVAVDIGCIECGEETQVLGIFTSLTRAEEVCNEHAARHCAKWRGQHAFEVFPVAEIDVEQRVEYE